MPGKAPKRKHHDPDEIDDDTSLIAGGPPWSHIKHEAMQDTYKTTAWWYKSFIQYDETAKMILEDLIAA